MRKFVSFILILSLFPVAFFATGFSYQKKIRGNVFLCGVNVQDLTEAEAYEKLLPLLNEKRQAKLYVRFSAAHTETVAFPALSLSHDFHEVFTEALRVKKRETAEFSLRFSYDIPDFSTLSQKWAKETNYAPKNAETHFFPDAPRHFSYEKEKSGRTLDEFRLLCDVLSALSRLTPETPQTVQAYYRTTLPDLTQRDLMGATKLLAEFSTAFSSSSPARKNNIALAAQKLHGVVILPGESLSFNEKVGERSKKNGFSSAKIILNGKYEEGVGGGVCQVSTTLYNAALLSGLSVTEYHPHSLVSSYVPPARDAMVNYGSADLVIRNDKDFPCYLVAKCTGENLSFAFYGPSDGYSYSLESRIESTLPPPPPVEEPDDSGAYPTLYEGEKMTVQWEKEGVTAALYLIKSKHGKVERTCIRKSTYAPQPRRIAVGKAKRP